MKEHGLYSYLDFDLDHHAALCIHVHSLRLSGIAVEESLENKASNQLVVVAGGVTQEGLNHT
jgi:hypothetical protein